MLIVTLVAIVDILVPGSSGNDLGRYLNFAQNRHYNFASTNVAHRFSAYVKSGTSSGTSFDARGMVTTQFIKTPGGWKMSAMAWDDERPGLSIDA